MQLIVQLKQALQKIWSKLLAKKAAASDLHDYKGMLQQANDRIARIERNYLILLKRVLEMDGVQLIVNSKARNMSKTIMQTATEENKGLSEIKPTIH